MKLHRTFYLSSLTILVVLSSYAQTTKAAKKKTITNRPMIVLCTVIASPCPGGGCRSACNVSKSGGGSDDNACNNENFVANATGDADTSDCADSAPPTSPSCKDVYQEELAACPKGTSAAATSCRQLVQTALINCENRSHQAYNSGTTPTGCAAVRTQNTDYCNSVSVTKSGLTQICMEKVQQAYNSCFISSKPVRPPRPLQLNH